MAIRIKDTGPVVGHVDPVRDFDRLFDRFFGTNTWTGTAKTILSSGLEDREEFVVDVPGANRENLSVGYIARTLTFTWAHPDGSRREVRVSLSFDADIDTLEVHVDDGVARVKAPESEHRGHPIKVQGK